MRASATMAADSEPVRPVLDLSGPRLKERLESLLLACEEAGGVEHVVRAVVYKSGAFAAALAEGRAATLDEATFKGLCALIAPVRRRIGAWLAANDFTVMRMAVSGLFAGDPPTTDARTAAFVASFPDDRAHRWARDLAGELLHYALPERYPLMARWVWDARTNTGALREIWFGADVDHMSIPVADDYAAFLMLREELSQFLAANGVFRDMPFYVDLLLAHVYADYVSSQGGTYLRADFSVPEDPLLHTRRMLGLDGIDPATGRTRLKLAEGKAFVLPERPAVN